MVLLFMGITDSMSQIGLSSGFVRMRESCLEGISMTFYAWMCHISPSGSVEASGSIERVQGSAGATEFGKSDAMLLQKKAKKKS